MSYRPFAHESSLKKHVQSTKTIPNYRVAWGRRGQKLKFRDHRIARFYHQIEHIKKQIQTSVPSRSHALILIKRTAGAKTLGINAIASPSILKHTYLEAFPSGPLQKQGKERNVTATYISSAIGVQATLVRFTINAEHQKVGFTEGSALSTT